MTKKDYELIASILNKYYTCKTTQGNLLAQQGFFELIGDFTDKLASKNPRFNRDMFLKACGVEVKHKHDKTCYLDCMSKMFLDREKRCFDLYKHRLVKHRTLRTDA